MEALFSFFLEHWPEATLVFALIIIACIATWKIKDWRDKINTTSNNVSNLPCIAHTEDLRQLKSDSSKLSDISVSIRKIEEWIMKLDINAMDDLVRKCSPYALTPIGKIMLSESFAKNCVDDNIAVFLERLESTKPLTAFDVEKNALTVVSSFSDDPMFNKIKDFLYKAPAKVEMEDPETGSMISVQITLPRILMMMSIYLRDKYFESHNELDTTDFNK